MNNENIKNDNRDDISSDLRSVGNNSQNPINSNQNKKTNNNNIEIQKSNLTTKPYTANITQNNSNFDKNYSKTSSLKSGEKNKSNYSLHKKNKTFQDSSLISSNDLLRLSKYSTNFCKTSYSNHSFRNKKKIKQKNDFHKTITDAAFRSCHILDKVVDNPRYLGFSEFQSKNTLLNSSYCWSFSKDKRFDSINTSKINDHLYTLPSVMTLRSTTLGLGERKDLRPVCVLGDPGAYNLNSIFDSNKLFKKGAVVTGRYNLPKDDSVNKPAPNAYKIENLNNKIPIIIKSRKGFFYDDDLKKKKFTVSMQKYFPKFNFVQKERFKYITFGIGKREPLYINTKTPGPGSYNIPSFCDRGLKGKLVIN